MGKKEAILRAVAGNTSIIDLLSKNRRASVVYRRKILMMALRYAGYSLEIIGQFIRRDHTTVNYGCATLSDKDKLYARRIVEDLGFPTYQPPTMTGMHPIIWRKPLPKLKPEPEKIKIEVLVPDYKNYVCKKIWREI